MGHDEEDELSKLDDFWDDDDDTIKPIDLQGDPLLATPKFDNLDDEQKEKDRASFNEGPATISPDSTAPAGGAPSSAPDAAPRKPAQSMSEDDKGLGDNAPSSNPAPGADSSAEDHAAASMSTPPNLDDIAGEKQSEEDKEKESARRAEERFLNDMDEAEAKQKEYLDVSERTYVKKGDYFDMFARDPALRDLHIGAGWDQRSFENAPIDVDLSLFLLDKEDMTREDGDFIFYNNMSACDGAIKLMEDSRTGAGDGDDERMFISLQGLPFDILKIRFVLSVYDEKMEGFSFDNVRNIYFRIANHAEGNELFCFELDPEDIVGAKAIEVGTMVREGPKWFFSADAKPVEGGHAAVAKSYGMLITEDTG